MLHTNFQGHRPFGSGEEDFLKFLPYIGLVAILVMLPGAFEQNFVPPFHEIWLWLPKRFLRRRCLKSGDDRRRRRTDNRACLYYKLTYEPKGSGELKIEQCYKVTCLSNFCHKLFFQEMKILSEICVESEKSALFSNIFFTFNVPVRLRTRAMYMFV